MAGIERFQGSESVSSSSLNLQHGPASRVESRRILSEATRSSSFFRDSSTISELERVLRTLATSREQRAGLRTWVPACGSGEEVYSIAILMQEAREQSPRLSLQIFATDLQSTGLVRARNGQYPLELAEDVQPRRLERFFEPDPVGYRIGKRVRDCVVFSVHDLDHDPPFSRLDLIACRNLRGIAAPEVQARLSALFHYGLSPDGYLVVEPGETWPSPELFAAESRAVFRRREVAVSGLATSIGYGGNPGARGERATAAAGRAARLSIERAVLENYAPACIVFNEHGEILRLFGQTGEFLEAPEGEPTRDLTEMVRAELRLELRAFVRRALPEKKRALQRLELRKAATRQVFQLSLEPLPGARLEDGLWALLIEEETAKVTPLHSARVESYTARLERELSQTREELAHARREFEQSNERFKVTNEELLSMNEELAATNEELESTKEMLESANLEFETLNAELEVRLNDLRRANGDLRNLLESTRIATVFLNRKLEIRTFTPATRELFNFIDSDHGRPLGDIAQRFDYESLEQDACEVLRTAIAKETQIQLRDGRWFWMRILAYRSTDNQVEGVVLTFVDVSENKRAVEQALERERRQALIAEIGLRALETSVLADFMSASLQLIGNELGVELADLCQFQTESAELTPVAAIGFGGDFRASSSEFLPGSELANWFRTRRGPLDLEPPLPERLAREGVASGIRIPIWAGRDEPFGLLGVYARTARSFSGQERHFLSEAAQIFTTAIQRRAIDQALSQAREAAALARSQEQLRRVERLASLGTFAAGIAHEVNNPLTSIALAAEYAQTTSDSSRRASVLESIVKNTQRCGRIVDGVLSFARDETTQRWPTPINDLVRGAAELVRSVEPQRLELVYELSEPSPMVDCNSTELEQVLVNLMNNSLQACPGTCRIELCTQSGGGKVRVSIVDNGPGISAENRARIFDPFFSTRRNAGGIGLGLSISHRIVRSLGGDITLAMEVDPGARFDIELPEWLPPPKD
jgi:signal transduction histidine kinase/chemotaxis methyl-accepting protein methylase